MLSDTRAVSIGASDVIRRTLYCISMRAISSKAVPPYPFEGGKWSVESNDFLSLRGKVGKGEPQEREEQATDTTSTAFDVDRPGTTIAIFALMTSRALVVVLLTISCKLVMCFSESIA